MGPVTPARLLAPLALVVAFVAVIAVVMASRPAVSDSESSAPATTTTTPARGRERRPARRRAYTVRAGDTLTVIAERTGVSVERIEELNPNLDAQALRVGQRLRLDP